MSRNLQIGSRPWHWNRPLILCAGLLEVTLGPAYLDGNDREDLAPYWDVRFALIDDLEIARLGFRYRFVEVDAFEAALAAQNFGLGLGSGGDFFHHTKFGVEAKYFALPNLSLLHETAFLIANSHERDGNSEELRVGVTALVRLGERAALDVGYRFRSLSGFEQDSAHLANTGIGYTILPGVDVRLGYSYSNFDEAVDSVLCNESYAHRGDVALSGRIDTRSFGRLWRRRSPKLASAGTTQRRSA